MRTLLAAITLFVTFAVGCGGGNGTSGTNPPLAQGAWEFAFVSSDSGCPITQISDGNLAVNGNQVSSQQVYTALYNPHWGPPVILMGWGTGSASGTVSGSSLSLDFSVSLSSIETACGDYDGLNATGTLSGNTMSGTWTSSGSPAENGSFTAHLVNPPSGTYSGSLPNFLLNIGDAASANLSIGSSETLTATMGGTTYTFTGDSQEVGNIITLSGNASGTNIIWRGYRDANGTYTGQPNSVWLESCGDIPQLEGECANEGKGLLTAQ